MLIQTERQVVKENLALMPFDTAKTGIPFYDMMLENPDYFRKNKGLVGKVVYMSPDEYIATAVKCMGTTTVERFSQVVDEKFILRYVNDMLRGVKFDMPVIECHRGYTEGRHRALAAKRVGVTKIPVYMVEKAEEKEPGIKTQMESEGVPMVREAVDKEFRANPALVSKEAAFSAYRGTSFVPEKRAEQAISGFLQEVQAIYER